MITLLLFSFFFYEGNVSAAQKSYVAKPPSHSEYFEVVVDEYGIVSVRNYPWAYGGHPGYINSFEISGKVYPHNAAVIDGEIQSLTTYTTDRVLLNPGTRYNNGLKMNGTYVGTWYWSFTTLPTAPTNLRFTNIYHNRVDLNWTSNNGSATVYKIYKSLSASGPWELVLTTSSSARSANITGLSASSTYYMRIEAINDADDIAKSVIVSVTTTKEPIEQAAEDAKAAKIAAESANLTMNNIISPKLSIVEGAIRDGSGNTVATLASWANQNASLAAQRADWANNNADAAKLGSWEARDRATEARDNALTASQNALNAKNSADLAGSKAATAVNQTWDSAENKSAATLSKEARDSANEAVEAINDTNTNLDSKLSNLQNSVTNIQNYIAPTLNSVTGHNNATATKGSSFKVSLDYSGANEYRIKLDDGSWSGWMSLSDHDSNGYFTVSGISSSGMHTIYVEIRFNGGTSASPVAKGKVTLFKL